MSLQVNEYQEKRLHGRCEVPMVAMEGVYSKTVARFGSFNRESDRWNGMTVDPK